MPLFWGEVGSLHARTVCGTKTSRWLNHARLLVACRPGEYVTMSGDSIQKNGHVFPRKSRRHRKGTHPHSNPTRKDWVTAPADLATNNDDYIYGCATAVKALTGAPATTSWRRGKKVKGNSIASGTAIATFGKAKNGHFTFKGHAAIFAGYEDGLAMYDQWWNESPIYRRHFSRRVVPYRCGDYVSNDGEAFYVIELTEDPNGDPMFCGPASPAGG